MQPPTVASLVTDRSRLGAAAGQLISACAFPSLLGPPVCGWIMASGGLDRPNYKAANAYAGGCYTLGVVFAVSAFLASRCVAGRLNYLHSFLPNCPKIDHSLRPYEENEGMKGSGK